MKLSAIIAIAPLTAVGLINDAVISICQSWPHGYWVSGLIREEVGRLWLIRTQKQHERLLRLFKRLLWPNECNGYHWSFGINRSNNQTKHSRITKTIGFEYRDRLQNWRKKITFTVCTKDYIFLEWIFSTCSEALAYNPLLLQFFHKIHFSSPITQYHQTQEHCQILLINIKLTETTGRFLNISSIYWTTVRQEILTVSYHILFFW